MWQRRILPPDAVEWTAEDMALLLRLRKADAAGAVGYLRKRLRSLKGLIVVYKPIGSSETKLRLTREGYGRYLFFRSQEALGYFQKKDVDAKWAFSLSDLDGRLLFDANGLLTQPGEDLYNRALAGRETFWKTSGGDVLGNRPPPRPSPAPAPKVRPAPEAEEPPEAPPEQEEERPRPPEQNVPDASE